MPLFLSDVVLSALDDYEGSVNDRVHQFMVATYGYDPDLAIDDMYQQRFASIGYDGSIQDNSKQYLENLGLPSSSVESIFISDNFILDEEDGHVIQAEDGTLLAYEV